MKKEEIGTEKKKSKVSEVWKRLFGKVIFRADISSFSWAEKNRLLSNFRRVARQTGDLVIFDGRYLLVLEEKKN